MSSAPFRGVEPMVLAEVVDTYRRWLHLPDPGALLAVLAVVAGNRMSGAPLWLLVVGPSGGGKTEQLFPVACLPDVHQAATMTEAALLSGTPKKEVANGSRGGLLRLIGDEGILLCKDFGSVLSMNRDARAALLAALREVYDGSWTRHVGADGGRTLHWDGKLGFLGGATGAIDHHHGVMGALGERFLMYRIAVDDPEAQARSSLDHHGREREMRAELNGAVEGLFASVGALGAPPQLDEDDRDRLVALATLVARARSPVIRDPYRREIELVPDSEAPGRLVGALALLLAGLRAIGATDPDAWRVTAKVGLDSMPAARRKALELLLHADEPEKTTAVAIATGLSNPAAHRTLQDLAAHNVVERISQGEGLADLWQPHRQTRDLYRTGTASEMSEPPISPSFLEPEHTYNNISEEVGL